MDPTGFRLLGQAALVLLACLWAGAALIGIYSDWIDSKLDDGRALGLGMRVLVLLSLFFTVAALPTLTFTPGAGNTATAQSWK